MTLTKAHIAETVHRHCDFTKDRSPWLEQLSVEEKLSAVEQHMETIRSSSSVAIQRKADVGE